MPHKLYDLWLLFAAQNKKNTISTTEKQGAPEVELGTSWSAVKCSAAELYPYIHLVKMNIFKIDIFLIKQLI